MERETIHKFVDIVSRYSNGRRKNSLYISIHQSYKAYRKTTDMWIEEKIK